MVPIIERLVHHTDPAIVFTTREWDGGSIPPDGAAEAIVDAWEAAGAPRAYRVIAGREPNALTIATENWAGDIDGALLLDWSYDEALSEGFVELLADLSVLASSPLTVLSHAAGGRQRAGWRSREGTHQVALQAVDPNFRYGLFQGLAGVAHRTILGDELTALFGEDRLAALPPGMAHRRAGRWVLTPTDDPLEWTYERWCEGEAAVIEMLGREHFFDPSTGALPTARASFAKVAPYPCRAKDPATEEWVDYGDRR